MESGEYTPNEDLPTKGESQVPNVVKDLTDDDVTAISVMLKTNEVQVTGMLMNHLVRTHPIAKLALYAWFDTLGALMLSALATEALRELQSKARES